MRPLRTIHLFTAILGFGLLAWGCKGQLCQRMRHAPIRCDRGTVALAKLHACPAGPDAAGLATEPAPVDREAYDAVPHNPFRATVVPGNDASTFSIDVDTASYANTRRFLLQQNQLPPPGAVRIEELVNYFEYGYQSPSPGDAHPLAVHTAIAGCPWAGDHRLLRVALKGREPQGERKPVNLVFLVDVSGSMQSPDKLQLLLHGLEALVRELGERDRVAIVTYAGASRTALASTSGARQERIIKALRSLQAGGSTNGAAGIQGAYREARAGRMAQGENRVILCTDGDFNVGISDRSRLMELIEDEAGDGITLTVLGFGRGNLNDAMLEELTNRGDGTYHYIDGANEARRVLVHGLTRNLTTIARDVKIQLFFDPARVAGWRLIGYENRRLRREDFNDDSKDAGEIGPGHTVTALYELVPAGVAVPAGDADPNPFLVDEASAPAPAAGPGALVRVRLRYKPVGAEASRLVETDVVDAGAPAAAADGDTRWAAAVAGCGMLLRGSPHAGDLDWARVRALAIGALAPDPTGRRGEFIELVDSAARLAAADGEPAR